MKCEKCENKINWIRWLFGDGLCDDCRDAKELDDELNDDEESLIDDEDE